LTRPDRFSISRIFQITPISTPGITHALTTATRAVNAPMTCRRSAASISQASSSPSAICSATDAATKTSVTPIIP